MFRYTVKHYIDGVVKFVGYLDSELYDEDFSKNPINGVDVQLIANNGFSLLERLPFFENIVDGEYSSKTGYETLLNFIFEALSKIKLPYNKLYFTTNTSTINTNINHILKDIYVSYSNWVDEDGKPLNSYEVIENVLKIFQLSIIEKDTNIFIIDNESKLKNSITYKVYNALSKSPRLDETIDNTSYLVEDLPALKLSSLNYDKIYNNQKIIADNYVVDTLVNLDLKDITKFRLEDAPFLVNHNVSKPWTEKRYMTHTEAWRNETHINFIQESNENGEDNYIKIPLIASINKNPKILSLVNIKTDERQLGRFGKFKLSFDWMLKDKENYLDGGGDIRYLKFYIVIQVGNYYIYDGSTDPYLQNYNLSVIPVNEATSIENGITKLIRLHLLGNDLKLCAWNKATTINGEEDIIFNVNPELLNGRITAHILNRTSANSEINVDDKELRIKNFKITAIDDNYEKVSNLEYEGIGDLNAEKKGKDIKLFTNSGYKPKNENNDIGKPNLSQLFYKESDKYKGIKNFSRGINTGDNYLLEELLLASTLANNKDKSEIIKFTCDYNNMDFLKPFISSFIDLNKKMVMIGCEIDYAQNEIKITIRRLREDILI